MASYHNFIAPSYIVVPDPASDFESVAHQAFHSGVRHELIKRHHKRCVIAIDKGRETPEPPVMKYVDRVVDRYWGLVIETARTAALTDHGCDGLGCGGTISW